MTCKLIERLLAALFLLSQATAWAVPALKVKKVITLADGTRKEVVLCGDENVRFYLDSDQNAYQSAADGRFVKADKASLVRQWSERQTARNKHRIERAAKWGLMDNAQPAASRRGGIRRAQWGAETNPVSGEKKGLVILVNFSDKKMAASHNQAFYDGYFNEVGFSKEGGRGSVHDYFLESSYGQFDLTFDVVGPVTVSQPMAYYGQNQYGADAYPAQMVSEACALADRQGIDFSRYDWDRDGMVDQVYVVYAGYGENMGAPANTIWPHESTLYDSQPYGDGDGPVQFDGVWVDTYAVSCELLGTTGTMPAGIGTACHEFSHCMGLPDMYDLNQVQFGMDCWDVMDFGSYVGENYGDCPTPYTSYERMYCGWLTPKVLDTPCVVSDMKALQDAPEAYIIYNDKDRNEYYMLENRQQKGFGAYAPGHGMLVLHVLFDSQTWIDNTVNTGSPQHMTIIAADNVYTTQTDPGDTWPGTTGKTALTDETTPAAILYNPNTDGRRFMGKSIEGITESKDGLISFIFAGGTPVDVPVAQPATDLFADAFTANWTAVGGATRYEVQLQSSDLTEQRYDVNDVALLLEDFSGFNNGTSQNGTVDVSAQVNKYMHPGSWAEGDGWEAKNIYTTPRNEMRIGSQRSGQVVGGSIYSPWLPTETKTVTVCFTVRQYGSDTEPVYLVMGEGSEGGAVGMVNPTKEAMRVVVTADADTNEWWWGLSCDGRCYVSEMNAYEGHVTEEQIEAGYIEVKRSETSIVETTDTHYTFTELSPERKYAYSVRAYVDKSRSQWSETVDVQLDPNADGIQSLTPDPSPRRGEIYNLAGQRLSAAPSHGIYIRAGKKAVVR